MPTLDARTSSVSPGCRRDSASYDVVSPVGVMACDGDAASVSLEEMSTAVNAASLALFNRIRNSIWDQPRQGTLSSPHRPDG